MDELKSKFFKRNIISSKLANYYEYIGIILYKSASNPNKLLRQTLANFDEYMFSKVDEYSVRC